MMNIELRTFDDFWKYAISPSIDYCIQDLAPFMNGVVSPPEDIDRYKKELDSMFHRKREWLKREYLPDKDNAILDFHKLAALLCRCIIGNKPFLFDASAVEKVFKRIKGDETIGDEEKLRLEIDNIYINYKCAFLVSEGISYIDLLFWVIERIKSCNAEESIIYIEFKERLSALQLMKKYKKSNHHDDFASSMIVALMKNDLLMRDFDYLLMAASMFQWQEHTKLSLLIDILSDPKNSTKYTIANINDFM